MSAKDPGHFFTKRKKDLEDPIGAPCSSKASREDVDLDLHMSASDWGGLVLHFLNPPLGPPKSS